MGTAKGCSAINIRSPGFVLVGHSKPTYRWCLSKFCEISSLCLENQFTKIITKKLLTSGMKILRLEFEFLFYRYQNIHKRNIKSIRLQYSRILWITKTISQFWKHIIIRQKFTIANLSKIISSTHITTNQHKIRIMILVTDCYDRPHPKPWHLLPFQ